MRLILDLESQKQQIVTQTNHGKLQGLVYDTLIRQTSYKYLHDSKDYKFFCFSNIFPPSPADKGDLRHFVISSSDYRMLDEIFSKIQDNNIDRILNIGEDTFRITGARLAKLSVKKDCTLTTANPITLRIPSNLYSRFKIPEWARKDRYVYWRSYLSAEILVRLVEQNLLRKFQAFDPIRFESMKEKKPGLITGYCFLREIVVTLSAGEKIFKLPASFWKFYFENLNEGERGLIDFALDVGLGERTSFGLGFVNVNRDGCKITTVLSSNFS